MAYKNLVAAKFRSFLTVLGIIIGVASVVVVMAIGASAQALIIDQVKTIGSDLIGILPGASEEKGPPASAMGAVVTTLKNSDLQALLNKNNVPDAVKASGYVSGIATTKSATYSAEASYQGVSASFADVENVDIEKGRFFVDGEDFGMGRVVVLGYNRAQDFFPNVDPIGKDLVIKDVMFKVIGVGAKRGSVAFSNPDDLIYIPVTTAQKVLLGIDYLNFIRIKVNSPDNIDRAIADVKATIRIQHHIKDMKDDDFSVRNAAQAISVLSSITDVLKYFLVSIAGISLIVGGVGVMNIMLISVNQRIREIGLRKAVGAKNTNIVLQFLIESVFITSIGGIIGIFFGILVAFLASVIINQLGYSWKFIISPSSILVATSVTILIGIIFGMYPARKAARVSPMEALRYE